MVSCRWPPRPLSHADRGSLRLSLPRQDVIVIPAPFPSTLVPSAEISTGLLIPEMDDLSDLPVMSRTRAQHAHSPRFAGSQRRRRPKFGISSRHIPNLPSSMPGSGTTVSHAPGQVGRPQLWRLTGPDMTRPEPLTPSSLASPRNDAGQAPHPPIALSVCARPDDPSPGRWVVLPHRAAMIRPDAPRCQTPDLASIPPPSRVPRFPRRLEEYQPNQQYLSAT